MEFELRLKADGFGVNQIHTDEGHEFYGQLKAWCLQRGIVVRVPETILQVMEEQRWPSKESPGRLDLAYFKQG